MAHNRRQFEREDNLAQLMRWRKNVFVQLPDGRYGIVGAINSGVVLHSGSWCGGQFLVAETTRIDDTTLFDGRGWSLEQLNSQIKSAARGSGTGGSYRVADFELQNYRSFGSFYAVYIDIKRELMTTTPGTDARIDWIVLDALVAHSNQLGLLYAAYRPIQDMTGYAYGTVQRSLERFGERDWLRVVRVEVPELGENARRWMVSPFVRWISFEYIEKALDLWNNRSSLYRNVMCNALPESRIQNLNQNPEQRLNQNPHHHHHHQDSFTNPKTTHPDDEQLEWVEERAEGKDTEPIPSPQRGQPARSATQREAQEQTPSPSSAPPPPPISRCRKPLDNGESEALAQKLKSKYKTHLSQCRQVVLRFGPQQIEAGLNWLEEQRSNGQKIRNEFGLLKWRLEHGIIDEHDEPPLKYAYYSE